MHNYKYVCQHSSVNRPDEFSQTLARPFRSDPSGFAQYHPGLFCEKTKQKRNWIGCGISIRPGSGCTLAVMAMTGRNQNASVSLCVSVSMSVCLALCLCLSLCLSLSLSLSLTHERSIRTHKKAMGRYDIWKCEFFSPFSFFRTSGPHIKGVSGTPLSVSLCLSFFVSLSVSVCLSVCLPLSLPNSTN